MSIKIEISPGVHSYISSDDRFIDIPNKFWKYLARQKKIFGLNTLIHECRGILSSIEEARKFEIWKLIDFLDDSDGSTRPYNDLDDFILNGLGLNKETVKLIEQLYLSFNPSEKPIYNDNSSVTDNQIAVTSNTVTDNKITVTPICEVCNSEFVPSRTDSRYCSSKCRQKAYRQRKSAE